jgi:hypothetical protein
VPPKAKPYAKYYYREPKAPAPEKLATMAKPIDPSQALRIEDRNDLLNSGYLEAEAGWCIMPDGSAYVANHTEMPGVTVDMFLWWFAWHALEPMRYKIWYRPSHYLVQPTPASRELLTTTSHQDRVQRFSSGRVAAARSDLARFIRRRRWA